MVQIDKTHNKFLAHELKMRFNFVRTLFLRLLKKPPPPLLWKIYICENFCLFYIVSTQTIYIYQTFHEMNGFVKLRAVSKWSTFFYTSCIEFPNLLIISIDYRLYSKSSLTLTLKEWRFNFSFPWMSMLFLNNWRVSSHISLVSIWSLVVAGTTSGRCEIV